MDSFYEDLKKARLLQGITIAEIEQKTCISSEFLNAIEEGKVSALPQPYIRAFLREYAEAVGLDAAETVKRFAEITGTPPPPPPLPAFGKAPQPPIETTGSQDSRESHHMQPWMKIALGVAALVIMLVVVWLLVPKSDRAPVSEIPFERAVKEAEGRAPSQRIQQNTSPAPTSPATMDSLTLIARTTERVWVEITLDDQKPQDLMVPANAQSTWKARDRFLVTVGNAGGVRFTLNNKELQPFGKPGQVVREVAISRNGIVIP
jgi:cytoskeletal protein RodZ